MDRKINGMEGFPKLYYPELYLLDGGYNAFYAAHPVSYIVWKCYCVVTNVSMVTYRKCVSPKATAA